VKTKIVPVFIWDAKILFERDLKSKKLGLFILNNKKINPKNLSILRSSFGQLIRETEVFVTKFPMIPGYTNDEKKAVKYMSYGHEEDQ